MKLTDLIKQLQNLAKEGYADEKVFITVGEQYLQVESVDSNEYGEIAIKYYRGI